MPRLVKPLAVVLAVPIVCAVVALAARAQWDHRWETGLRREFLQRRQPVNQAMVARFSLPSLCSDGRAAATLRPCRTRGLLTRLATGAAVVGGAGLSLLAAIALLGAACRGNRHRLVRVFQPALRASIGGLAVLVLLHGALGIAAVYLLGEFVERWPVAVVFAMAMVALLAALSMVQVALAVMRTGTTRVVGRVLDAASQPRLLPCIGELAARVGARRPERVVAALSPQVFATEAPLETLDGTTEGPTVCLSLPLARILSVEEFSGLIAHELAHFDPQEAGFSTRVSPAYIGAVRAIASLEQGARGWRRVVTFPAVAVLGFALERFFPSPASIGRDRELKADQAAARVVGVRVLATALVKAHAFWPAWEPVSVAMECAVDEQTQYANLSELFALIVADHAGPERLAGVGRLSLPHPMDLRPSLQTRLAALGVTIGEVAAAALDTQPAAGAISLFEDHEVLERDLSEVEHRLLALRRGAKAVADGLEEAGQGSASEALPR